MLGSQSINVMDKVTIQYGSLRKSYDIFSLPSQMYDFMEKEGFCLPRRKTIADVPNEILTLIFQHLDKKSLKNVLSVSQRFFDQGAPLLWSTVLCRERISQDDEDGFDLPELLAKALTTHATKRPYELLIRKLNITVAESLSAELCGSIHRIFGFIPHMSNLTHLQLSIYKCEEEYEAFLDRMELNLCLTFIELMKLPRLQVLNVEPLNLEIVCRVLETEYNFSLENWTINELHFGLPTMPVSGGYFQRFIQSFKVLESLELWDVDVLSISLWAEILSSKTITHLHVNYADFEIAENPSVLLPSNLKSLLLHYVSSESDTLRLFLSPMCLLTRLELRDCRLLNIGEISPIADMIPQLEVFYYSSMEDTFGPSVFRSFGYPISRLRKLSIQLSLADGSILREFTGIPTLEEVCLFDTEVSETRLADFFQSNTALRHVELYNYPLDPSYLLPLLQHCPNIETFTTSGSVDESIQVLDEMVKKHPNLHLPMFQFDRVHGLKRNFEDYLRLFPRLANHLKFNYW